MSLEVRLSDLFCEYFLEIYTQQTQQTQTDKAAESAVGGNSLLPLTDKWEKFNSDYNR